MTRCTSNKNNTLHRVMPVRYRVLFYVGMSFAMLMVLVASVFVLRPAHSCEIVMADIFCELSSPALWDCLSKGSIGR